MGPAWAPPQQPPDLHHCCQRYCCRFCCRAARGGPRLGSGRRLARRPLHDGWADDTLTLVSLTGVAACRAWGVAASWVPPRRRDCAPNVFGKQVRARQRRPRQRGCPARCAAAQSRCADTRGSGVTFMPPPPLPPRQECTRSNEPERAAPPRAPDGATVVEAAFVCWVATDGPPILRCPCVWGGLLHS
jgi:hypothetical protein